jgi:tetratricopeptide (TPR) repeat protein
VSRSTIAFDPGAPPERLAEIYDLIRAGEVARALHVAADLERTCASDADGLQRVAECYTHCAQHALAHRVLHQAAHLVPNDARCLYNLAAAAVAVGRIGEAEALFTRTLALNPHDYDAWYNRSTLRTQTAESNHVRDLEDMLDAPDASRGEIALCYALAKELEDLGEHERSFAFLTRGAAARRRQLRYRVAGDEEALSEIIRTFDGALLSRAPRPQSGAGPIFIVGLPRSGTTLVDRILSSHSEVASLGELHDLPLAVTAAAGGAAAKQNLIRRAALADFPALGRDYLRRIAGYGAGAPCLIDKTPLNYLYLGLIRLSLPNARIVHVRRQPLDSCFAMYKTLFRMGYPFSYDLEDLGRYYVAYERLMSHWRALLPEGFLDLDYEALVREQGEQSRRLLEWCGLQWQPQCLEFHRNPAPIATASAAQVREPLHARSVGTWKRHEVRLQPLIRTLRAGGVRLE